MFEWIRFGIVVLFLFGGVIAACCAVYGVYRFHFVLNRMHAAAIIDTLVLLLVIIALIICSGLSFQMLKLLLVLGFLWFASPVSSHLISRLEVESEQEIVRKECEVEKR